MDESQSLAGLGSSQVRDAEVQKLDVESWLPDAPPTETSAPSLGKMLFEAVLDYFILLGRRQLSDSDNLMHEYRREAERLFLWGHGVSAHSGHLDLVLSRSQDLQLSVLTILSSLARCVTNGAAQLLGHQGDVDNGASELQRLIDLTTIHLSSSDTAEEEEQESGSEGGSATSVFEFKDFLEDIKTYIDCLADLSQALQDLVDNTDPSVATEAHLPLETFEVSSHEALVFCRKIRDRFRGLDKWLVERLGEGNAHRSSILRDFRDGSLQIVKDGPYTRADQGFSESSDHGMGSLSMESCPRPGVTETTGSTRETKSIFSNPPQAPRRTVNLGSLSDGEDDVTVASFSTAASAVGSGYARVPPMPRMALQGKPFHCFICNQSETLKAKTRKAWKQHIFADLLPYMCILPNCETGSTLYSSSRAWRKHELSHIPHLSSFPRCPFCGMENKSASDDARLKHVTRHLQEISLAVLPQIGGQETESDDSSSTDEILGEDRGDALGIDEAASERSDDNSTAPSWSDYDDGVDKDSEGEPKKAGGSLGRTTPSLANDRLYDVDIDADNLDWETDPSLEGSMHFPPRRRGSENANPVRAHTGVIAQSRRQGGIKRKRVNESTAFRTNETLDAVSDSMPEDIANTFMSLVNKGPESTHGYSFNKILKRYHRRRAETSLLPKSLEEKELFKLLRLRRNDRGEVVMFHL